MGTNGEMTKGFEFNKFATPRIIGGIVIVVIVIWALVALFGSPYRPPASPAGTAQQDHAAADHAVQDTASHAPQEASHQVAAVPTAEHGSQNAPSTGHGTTPAAGDEGQHATETAVHEATAAHGTTASSASAGHAAETTAPVKAHPATAADSHGSTAAHSADATTTAKATSESKAAGHQSATGDAGHGTQTAASGHESAGGATVAQHAAETSHAIPATAMTTVVHKPAPKGVTFVEASMKPLNYELEERWWGWRPNDIINVTDNVNNYQLGVLEVTRRMIVALAERISRTGTTDAYDENLEQAMNWFMVKATTYWFPSAESKYTDGLDEMEAYLEKLKEGKARFYTRTDNLIPLLASFEDLLGSCDENLVKEAGEDGEPVSFFSVDDYFYYTQGVANTMATMLEAVHHDFLLTLESRNATDLLHHAIVACQRAAAIEPWIILDPELDSVFANHRANMAAPISHARFYLGQLIKTLST